MIDNDKRAVRLFALFLSRMKKWKNNWCLIWHATNWFYCFSVGKDGSKVTTVVATPGQGPDRPQEVSYSDTKVIGNGSFGVVFQAKLCDTGELVAIKKVLQDKRFKVRKIDLKLIDHN